MSAGMTPGVYPALLQVADYTGAADPNTPRPIFHYVLLCDGVFFCIIIIITHGK